MRIAQGDRSLLRIGLALLAALVLGAGGLGVGFVLLIVTLLVLTSGLGIELSPVLYIVLSLVFVQGVGCAGVALVYRSLRPSIASKVREKLGIDGEFPAFSFGVAVPSLKQVGIVAGGYVAAIVGAAGGGVLLSQLDVQTGQNAAAQIGMENPEVLLLLIPGAIVLNGPGEELLFRGVVQGRLREVFSAAPAIGIASVLFAGLHWVALTGGSPAGNVAALGILLVPAIVLGAAYEFTENIVVPSLIHGLYNATLFSILYVSVVYGDQFVPSELLIV